VNADLLRRLLVGLMAVLGAAVLLLLIEDAPSEAQVCIGEEDRERARIIMIDGIDDALKAHTKFIFDIWMKDPSDQPKRAIIGMRAGVSAWARSRAAATNWDPPVC
jgi:hypothetical protein